jgi:soluble lytic murein transglycosylase
MMPLAGPQAAAVVDPSPVRPRNPILLALQVVGTTLAIASLLVIYLPDLPVVGRVFYPFHYQDEIEHQSKVFGLDPLFVAAIVRQESGFRPGAKSRVGAVGLMQVMPKTARWGAEKLGIKNYKDEQLTEPATNIRIGCWYLSYLFQKFKDPAKVLAAYNGGEGNVDYWGTLQGEQLAWAYPETQTYVAQCLRSYRRYKELYAGEVSRVVAPTMRLGR